MTVMPSKCILRNVLLAIIVHLTCWQVMNANIPTALSSSTLSLFFIVTNLTTFVMFAVDKTFAVVGFSRSRIPEVILHMLTLAGGFIGQRFAIALLHHKSNRMKNPNFSRVRTFSFFGWTVLGCYYFVPKLKEE